MALLVIIRGPKTRKKTKDFEILYPKGTLRADIA
jgi:hypothetical protein